MNWFFGIPRSASYDGRNLDGGRILTAVAGKDEHSRRAFLPQAGIQGSTVEGSVLDQLFDRPDETSVSTTQLFAIAARQGMRLFAVTAQNLNQVQSLGTSREVKEDIANAVAAGRVAFVPEGDIDHRVFLSVNCRRAFGIIPTASADRSRNRLSALAYRSRDRKSRR